MKSIELPCQRTQHTARTISPPATIADARLLELRPFQDVRGSFEVVWERADFIMAGIDFKPASSAYSYNAKPHTLRGLHFQKIPYGQSKVVSCVHGRIWDVVADLRPNSPSYLCWAGTELHASSGRSVYVPAGVAHGFLTLTENATVAYLIEGDYRPEAAGVARWNDAALGISWPVNTPVILSERDRLAPDLQQ